MTDELKKKLTERFEFLAKRSEEQVSADIYDALLKAYLAGSEYGYQYAQEHPAWVSVEDELPREKGAYLFHFDDGQTRVEGYFPDLHLSKCVTHWMEIVPPVKKGGEK